MGWSPCIQLLTDWHISYELRCHLRRTDVVVWPQCVLRPLGCSGMLISSFEAAWLDIWMMWEFSVRFPGGICWLSSRLLGWLSPSVLEFCLMKFWFSCSCLMMLMLGMGWENIMCVSDCSLFMSMYSCSLWSLKPLLFRLHWHNFVVDNLISWALGGKSFLF